MALRALQPRAEEHLGHVAGHNHEIRLRGSHGAGFSFNPLHPFGTQRSASDHQHCRGGIDADHVAAVDCSKLPGQHSCPAPQVKDPTGIEVRGKAKVEVGVSTPRIIAVVQLYQARVHVVQIELHHSGQINPLPSHYTGYATRAAKKKRTSMQQVSNPC